MNRDMYTLKDASDLLELNINTLRYRLNKNADDCDMGIYETKLYNLLEKIKVVGKKTMSKKARIYERYVMLDLEEFKKEYKKYENFLKENKKMKRKDNLGWTNTAIECYQRGMNCKSCICEKICKKIANSKADKIPPMKKLILKLLAEIGLPPKISIYPK